jgi:REP element-mobilizing transposase RayT
MSRNFRSYQPGMVFHVTSRTNGKEHWFDETIRTEVVSILATCFRRSDAQLLAYVVMTNHFHLILRQGGTPLGRIMQSINTRIALCVQRYLGRTGHIFERRYRERPCADPDYLRNAIVYTHLNPVRAGFCGDVAEYRWSSHMSYMRHPLLLHDAHPNTPDLTPATEVFADATHRTSAPARSDYERFLKWRLKCDLVADDPEKPTAPRCADGDEYWALHFGGAKRVSRGLAIEKLRPDLRDLVRQTLRDVAPGLTLELLRLRSSARMIVSVRRIIVKRAVLAGFRGAHIARYLNVSEATVSVILSSLSPRIQCARIHHASNGQS